MSTGQSLGKYEVLDVLAPSETASVRLAKANEPDGSSRAVVVKRVSGPSGTPADRFAEVADDAQPLTRIRHPNLVALLEVIAAENELYFISEYATGETFAKLLKGARAKSVAAPIKIISAIAVGALRGLHAIHEQAPGLAHRDVSPQNILVGRDGVGRVLELGVARAKAALASREGSRASVPPPAGQVKPTSAYKSPEQIRAEPVDRRSDIFSMAIVLWEALTGSALFRGVNEGQILLRVLSGKVSRPSRLVRGVTPALDNIVMKGVNADPKARFQTAEEFAAALEQRVGVASPEEVSAWVNQIAGELLTARAALAAPLEHRLPTPTPPPPPPEPEPIPIPVDITEPEPILPIAAPVPQPVVMAQPTESPRLEPAPSPPIAEPPRRQGRPAWIIPVVVLVLLASAAVVVLAFLKKRGAESESPPPTASAPVPPISAATSAPIEEPAAPVESAPAPAPSASTESAPDAGKARTAPHRGSKRPAKSTKKSH